MTDSADHTTDLDETEVPEAPAAPHRGPGTAKRPSLLAKEGQRERAERFVQPSSMAAEFHKRRHLHPTGTVVRADPTTRVRTDDGRVVVRYEDQA